MVTLQKVLTFLDEMKIDYNYIGRENISIYGFSLLNDVNPNTIIWIKKENMHILPNLKFINDVVIVIDNTEQDIMDNANIIFSKDSKASFFSILDRFFSVKKISNFMGANSIIKTNSIGKNIFVGYGSYIGKSVKIGNNVRILNNVCIEGKVIIGNNTTISSGCVLGSEGYGYFIDNDGINTKVPHFGGIIVGDNVEIGANTCIDRGTLGNTIIGTNTKIDNLCHIAHNVIIEENVSITALSMIAGSVHIKKNSYLAPSSSIINQVTIGKNSLVGLGAVVVKDVKDNVIVAGVPAKVIRSR